MRWKGRWGRKRQRKKERRGGVGKSEDSNATGQSRARVISLRDPGDPGMIGPWKEVLVCQGLVGQHTAGAQGAAPKGWEEAAQEG